MIYFCVPWWPSTHESNNIRFFLVSWLFIFLTLLSQKHVFPKNCFTFSPMILLVYLSCIIVTIRWSMWIWYEVASIARIFSVEEIFLFGTTVFALWYPVFPALIFWVILRSCYSSAKKYLIQSKFFCLWDFSSIPCRHQRKFQILIPHDGPSVWIVMPCKAYFRRFRTAHIHQFNQSIYQSARTSQSAHSFTDC